MYYTIVINVIETSIFCYFLTNAAQVKKPKIIPVLVYLILSAGTITLFNFYDLDQSFYFVIDASFNFLYLSLISEYETDTKIIIALIPNLILTVLSLLVIIVSSEFLLGRIDMIQLKDSWGMETDLMAQFLYIVTFMIAAKKIPFNSFGLSKKEKWMLIAALIDCEFMLMAVSSLVLVSLVNETNITIALLCMIVFITLLLLIFTEITRQNERVHKTEYEKDLLDSQLVSINKLLKSQNELLQIRHDMKHLFSAFKDTDNLSPESIAELNKMRNDFDQTILPIETISPAINAVVNTKRQEALEKHIEMTCTLNVAFEPHMEKDDLCLLLSNLLDNAIQHIGLHKQINLNLYSDASKFMIRIRNSCDIAVLDKDHHLIEHDHGIQHGYGLRTIRSLTEKYHGDMNMDQTPEEFAVIIILPQSEKH